jgi:hypothetical protein
MQQGQNVTHGFAQHQQESKKEKKNEQDRRRTRPFGIQKRRTSVKRKFKETEI